MQRLKEAAEKAKIELSSSQQTDVNLPYITADASAKHLNVKISRAKLESLVEDLVERTIEPCRIALKDAGIDVSKINDVISVWPDPHAAGAAVAEFFGKEARKDVNGRSRGHGCCHPRAPCWRATSRTCCCSTFPR